MFTNSSKICPVCKQLDPRGFADGPCTRCIFASALEPTDVGGFEPREPSSLEDIQAAFPQLEVERQIGAGGMGVVYKAQQRGLDRAVALKILPVELASREGFSRRFQDEAKALGLLSHPHIVTVHDSGLSGEYWYLVMEFVDGATVRRVMKPKGIPLKEALDILLPVCEGLQEAHEKGIVHRDIKPENLLQDKSGKVKIADFGIAKIIAVPSPETVGGKTRPSSSAATGSVGTGVYTAPEQCSSRPTTDHRADIYSLGVVMYQMLTGELPDKEYVAPSKRANVDSRVDKIVRRALQNDPNLRYQNIGEMRKQLAALRKPRLLARPAIWGLIVPFFAIGAGLWHDLGGTSFDAAFMPAAKESESFSDFKPQIRSDGREEFEDNIRDFSVHNAKQSPATLKDYWQSWVITDDFQLTLRRYKLTKLNGTFPPLNLISKSSDGEQKMNFVFAREAAHGTEPQGEYVVVDRKDVTNILNQRYSSTQEVEVMFVTLYSYESFDHRNFFLMDVDKFNGGYDYGFDVSANRHRVATGEPTLREVVSPSLLRVPAFARFRPVEMEVRRNAFSERARQMLEDLHAPIVTRRAIEDRKKSAPSGFFPFFDNPLSIVGERSEDFDCYSTPENTSLKKDLLFLYQDAHSSQ